MSAPGAAPMVDLAALRTAAQVIAGEQCYAQHRAGGIEYRQALRSIEHLHVGVDAHGRPQIVAALALPAALRATQAQYLLHPSLLDGALQAQAALPHALGEQHRVDQRAAPEAGQRGPGVAALQLLQAAGVVGDHRVDRAVQQAPPQRLLVGGGADRRVDLGPQVAFLVVQAQVVERRLQHHVQLRVAPPHVEARLDRVGARLGRKGREHSDRNDPIAAKVLLSALYVFQLKV